MYHLLKGMQKRAMLHSKSDQLRGHFMLMGSTGKDRGFWKGGGA